MIPSEAKATPSKPKAVVLLSGGLDSTTTLAIAQREGFDAYALSFRYGQRHAAELAAATRVATRFGLAHHVVAEIDLRLFGGSALTSDIEVPKGRTIEEMGRGIPVTYVPGAQHDLPVVRARLGRGARGAATSSSASTPSTTAAIRTAGPSTSPPSSAWPTSPPKPGSRARSA